MISIRRFSDKDLDMVKDFYYRSYGDNVQRKIDAFRWIQAFNPFADNENSYVLMLDDGKIIGYWGVMPTPLYYRGERFMASFSQEALVDPAFRNQGIGAKLLEEVNKTGGLMVSLWHNEAALGILKRKGWSNVGQYRPLKRIHKVRSIVKLRNPYLIQIMGQIVKSRLRANEFNSNSAARYNLAFVDRCNNEFDQFFMNVSSKLGIIPDRTSKTLNWKYIDIPYKKYIFISAKRENKLCGYMILRIEEEYDQIKKGIIVDFLADIDEPEVLVYLIKKCDEIFSQNNVDFSVSVVQTKAFRNVFKKNGYFEARSRKTDSLCQFNESSWPAKEVAKDIREWYFTYGDSDGDMW